MIESFSYYIKRAHTYTHTHAHTYIHMHIKYLLNNSILFLRTFDIFSDDRKNFLERRE